MTTMHAQPPTAPTSASSSPAPAAPAWLEGWLAGDPALELASLRELAAEAPPALRAAFERFPPGCVVRCACGEARCSRALSIVSGAAVHPARGVVLLVRGWPEDLDFEVPLERARFDVVHLRGGVTVDVVRAVLGASAGSA